jgi:hypothetical protein
MKLGGPPMWFEHFGEKKNFLSLLGIEPRIFWSSIPLNELWQICFAVSGRMPFPILELVSRCRGSSSFSQSVILELA